VKRMLVEPDGEKGKTAASPSGLLPEDSYAVGEGPSTSDTQSIPQAVEPEINLPEPVPKGHISCENLSCIKKSQ